MDIIISSNSDTPLYEQIVDQIKAQILTGELLQGTPLPSIRALAKDLHVSIITTKRAYEELEALGLIDTLVGKGTFVSAKPIGQVKEAAMLHLEEKIAAIIEQAKTLGLSKEELITLFSTLYEEEL